MAISKETEDKYQPILHQVFQDLGAAWDVVASADGNLTEAVSIATAAVEAISWEQFIKIMEGREYPASQEE